MTDQHGFRLESAAISNADRQHALRSMSELERVAAELDAVLPVPTGHNPAPELVATSLDSDRIWKNYNAGKATAFRGSTLKPETVNLDVIERRLGRR